jgi:hypothetical protein
MEPGDPYTCNYITKLRCFIATSRPKDIIVRPIQVIANLRTDSSLRLECILPHLSLRRRLLGVLALVSTRSLEEILPDAAQDFDGVMLISSINRRMYGAVVG